MSFIRFAVAVALLPSLPAQSPIVSAAVNSGDYAPTGAPGGLVSLFGSNLANHPANAGVIPLPETLLGSSVQVIDGRTVLTVPLWFVSPDQINLQLPYGLTNKSVQLRVQTPDGLSPLVNLDIAARAPRFLTTLDAGATRPVLTKLDNSLVTAANPLRPGEYAQLFLIGLGPVDPSIPAGAAPNNGTAGQPLHRVTGSVSVILNDTAVDAIYAGLAPGWPGLYQVNFQMPNFNLSGDVSVAVRAGSHATQGGIGIPVAPNGFYWAVTAGLFPNAQTRGGIAGPSGALAFFHKDSAYWGSSGLNAWTSETGLTDPSFRSLSGIALTLRNGPVVVYDNNGIDNPTAAVTAYYTVGQPGLNLLYANSQVNPALFAGYFRLPNPVTFTEISGYFDCNGLSQLPFNPAGPFNRWRMNIWSSSANIPLNTGSFTGDIWSTDAVPGVFAWFPSSVSRVLPNGKSDPVCRLAFTPSAPQTLPAGEFWFSHDVGVPSSALTLSTARSRR